MYLRSFTLEILQILSPISSLNYRRPSPRPPTALWAAVRLPIGFASLYIPVKAALGGSDVAPIDIGVRCDVAAVRVVGRRLYEKVFAKLVQAQTQRPPPPHP